MNDLHPSPLLTRDMPWPMARASVFKDPDTGLWCWSHQCAQRLPGMPFHGIPQSHWFVAYGAAFLHMRWCVT